METVTVIREHTTLDLLLFRRHGPEGQALIADALTLNPGVAGLGVELPIGTIVKLPDVPEARSLRRTDIVDLFGGN